MKISRRELQQRCFQGVLFPVNRRTAAPCFSEDGHGMSMYRHGRFPRNPAAGLVTPREQAYRDQYQAA